MSLALRSHIAISFVLVLTPSLVSAQQLSQPMSLQPWVPLQMDAAKPLPTTTKLPAARPPGIPQQMPVWMTTQTPAGKIESPHTPQLPMVERHHFANLDGLPASAQPGLASPPVTPRSNFATSNPVRRRTEIAAPLRFLRRVR